MTSATPDNRSQSASAGLSRRTLVKTAAWAAPAVAVSAVVPRAAASTDVPPNGLGGWILFSRDRSANIDVQGWNDPPSYYLEVTQTQQGQTIEKVEIVVLFSQNLGVFSTQGGSTDNSGAWPTFAYEGTETISGSTFYRYRMTYAGLGTTSRPAPPFVVNAATGANPTTIDNRMHFRAATRASGSLTLYTRRYVTITTPGSGTTVVSLIRGPITLG